MDKQQAAREAFEKSPASLPHYLEKHPDGQYMVAITQNVFKDFSAGYQAAQAALMPALVEARDALERIRYFQGDCPVTTYQGMDQIADKALARINAVIGDKK